MKRLLIVCGGEFQIPIVQKAKSLGYEVVNSNLYEDSPSFKYADFTEVIDVLDYQKNYACAMKYHVDGVIAEQNELSVFTVAYVSEKMGLPSITTKLAALFTNKYKMREFCRQEGFLYPNYHKCDDLNEAKAFFLSNAEKMIMKPLDSFSSKGVYVINSVKDCEKFFLTSRSFSRHQKSVILEEYLEGTEFTIDGIVLNGKHYTLAISQKSHYKHNKNIACRLYFSYYNESFDYDHLREIHNRLIEKTGLPLGLTHSEYKYCNGQYFLIEMAARGGGNFIAPEIVPELSGIDTYELYIKSAVNDPLPDEEELMKSIAENRHKHILMEFLDICTEGKSVKRISGIEEIYRIPNILHFKLNFQPGDVVNRAIDDGSRPGFYIAVGESKEELERLSERIYSILRIEVNE